MTRARSRSGAPAAAGMKGRLTSEGSASGLTHHGRYAFTLIEMCMVLFIMALLFAVTIPSIHSAFSEHAVREDSHQLALMVRTAMIQSSEQHRPYVIDLTKDSMALHPMGETTADNSDATDTLFKDSGSTNADTEALNTVSENVEVTSQLDAANKLVVPDPVKVDKWIDMPDGTQWVFQPGELCPATRVRFERGDSWLEVSFAALTGNVEDEKTYFP